MSKEQREFLEAVAEALLELKGRMTRLEVIEEATREMISGVAQEAGMEWEEFAKLVKDSFKNVDHPDCDIQIVTGDDAKETVDDIISAMMKEANDDN